MHKPAPLIKKGDDPRRDWQRINQDSKAIGDLQREVAVLRQSKRDAGGGFEITREPFQIYNTPNTLRQLEEREEDAWRKFKVRAGFIDMVPCAKTDDADGTCRRSARGHRQSTCRGT